MGYCVGFKDNTQIKCDEPTKPGRKYCEEHGRARRGGLNERENDAINNVVDAAETFGGEKIELVKQPEARLTTADVPLEQQNIYDKVNNELNDMITWEKTTRDWMLGLSKEEIRYQDKAGAEQLHSFVTLYERAQDRVLRGVTAVAKLGIDAQSINVNKMLRELIKQCLVRALKKYGMDDLEIDRIRSLVSDEFEMIDKAG